MYIEPANAKNAPNISDDLPLASTASWASGIEDLNLVQLGYPKQMPGFTWKILGNWLENPILRWFLKFVLRYSSMDRCHSLNKLSHIRAYNVHPCMPIDGWIHDISFLARPRYICTNAAQSTFSPVGSMTFSLTTFPYFEKTSVLFRLCSVAGFQRDPERWTARSWKSGIPSGSPQSQVQPPLIHWWNENETTCSQKEQKKGQNAKIVAQKRKLRSWLSNPHPSKRGIEVAGPLT